MMKRFVLLALCLVLSLSACGTAQPSSAPAQEPPAQSSALEQAPPTQSSALEQTPPAQSSESGADAAVVEKTFGTFTLPQGWFESKELSRDNNYFYLKEGSTPDSPTSNISVSSGTNRYGKGEEIAFAQAIDRQLKAQVGPEVINYTGSGSYTEQGLTLITMTVEAKDALTVQYYIVGEYKFVMVHMTDFYDERVPDVQQAALDIVDSFAWAVEG